MSTYLFQGIVLPERAQLSMQVGFQFSHLTSGTPGSANVSIVLNQIAVWIETAIEWDIFDLRNAVKTLLRNELAVIGYLHGLAYDVEVRRVLNRELGVDYVFGIDIPIIAQRRAGTDLNARVASIRQMTVGPEGVLLNRCFSDLVSAMQNPDDTAFYCYRAIESLRHHCGLRHEVPGDKRARQWAKFREVAGCSEADIMVIKQQADPLRHGNVGGGTGADRAILFKTTWDIVDAYLSHLGGAGLVSQLPPSPLTESGVTTLTGPTGRTEGKTGLAAELQKTPEA